MFLIIWLSGTAICFLISFSMLFYFDGCNIGEYEINAFDFYELEYSIWQTICLLGICFTWWIVLPIAIFVSISYLIAKIIKKLARKKND
ncbi:MAG: hypothetical protein WCO84_01290 [bacterium]